MELVILTPESARGAGEKEDTNAEEKLRGHEAQCGETEPGVEAEHVGDGGRGEAVRLPDGPDAGDARSQRQQHKQCVDSFTSFPEEIIVYVYILLLSNLVLVGNGKKSILSWFHKYYCYYSFLNLNHILETGL